MNRYLLEYDSQPDSAYIRVARKRISRTVEMDSTTLIDLDKDNHIVGVEILNFSTTKADIGQLITKQLGNLASVAK